MLMRITRRQSMNVAGGPPSDLRTALVYWLVGSALGWGLMMGTVWMIIGLIAR